jgi:hypothetical protein
MIANIGDVKTFILNGNTPAQPMRYVWQWWDGSVDVTSNGTVSKQLNVGGNPADSYQVRFSCEAVNEVGQSSQFDSALVVNNPPSLVLGSTSLSNNGGDFSFRARASLIAYDLENDALGFQWYAGGQSLGGGNPSFYGQVDGTYAGTLVGSFAGTNNYIDYDVTSNGSLTCYVYDLSGGTTAIQFFLFGQSPTQQYSAPQALAYQSAIDSTSSSIVRIGQDVFAEFTVYTGENSNPTNFNWTFHGSNGWVATTYSTGTTTLLATGAFQNQVLKTTASETAGQKYAEVQIVDTVSGLSADFTIPVFLEANAGPEIASSEVLPFAPGAGEVLSFEVTATDPELDILTYRWSFPDFPLTMYGRKVFVDSTGISPGNVVHGVVTITDKLGASVTQNVDSSVLS